MNEIVYLDHAATTPLAPEARIAMDPFLTHNYGNPSSIHALGRRAREAADVARDIVASALHCEYSEIAFTSGGTEADNLAILGAMFAAPDDRRKLVISGMEHHAILHSAHWLETMGFEVVIVPVNSSGKVEEDDLVSAVDKNTALVSIMHGNNEIGVVQDVPRFAAIAHAAGALFHTDAVQTFGHLPLHVRGMDVDMLTMSAHKIYGPKGVGALYIKTGTRLQPMAMGGTQERERRAGTENIAGIVGFGAAVIKSQSNREAERLRLIQLKDWFVGQLLNRIPPSWINSGNSQSLPHIINFGIQGLDGATALMALDRMGICASSGAACSSGSIEPSHVLLALGQNPEKASAGIRFSLGESNNQDQLEYVLGCLEKIAFQNNKSVKATAP